MGTSSLSGVSFSPPMAVCKASSALYSSPSPAGTFANHVPVKQAVWSTLPKSNLLFSKNQRALLIKQDTRRKRKFLVQAQYSDRKSGGAGDFFTGFVLGGVVFGTLGYLFAPQINKLVSAVEREIDESSKRLPKGLDDDEGLEKTRRNLNEKIAQLNAAIDDVSAQLRADNKLDGEEAGSTVVEFESAA